MGSNIFAQWILLHNAFCEYYLITDDAESRIICLGERELFKIVGNDDLSSWSRQSKDLKVKLNM